MAVDTSKTDEEQTRRHGPPENRDDVMQHVQAFVDTHGIEHARRIGITYEGEDEPTPEELREAAEGTVVIRVELHRDGQVA